jgi:hypothetical protein
LTVTSSKDETSWDRFKGAGFGGCTEYGTIAVEGTEMESKENPDEDLIQIAHAEMVSVKDAAILLNLSIWQVYKLDRERGQLKFAVVGHRIMVELRSIRSYLACNQSGPISSGSGLPVITSAEAIEPRSPSPKAPASDARTIEDFDQIQTLEPLPMPGRGQRELTSRAPGCVIAAFFSSWALVH